MAVLNSIYLQGNYKPENIFWIFFLFLSIYSMWTQGSTAMK